MALLSDRYKNDGIATVDLSDIQRKYIDIFRKKCESGEYKFRERECECGNGDLEIISQKDRYGLPVTTVICRNCGLIMTSPCLDDASNNAFYDNEYHYIYRAEDKPSDKNFLNRKSDAARSIIPFIRKNSGLYEGTVLEIGCADGGNVAAFAEYGYTASGIDLSHTYTEFGKSKGLDLYCSDASSFAKKGLQYDLIVINHVLEHFTDLKKELNTISRMLKPGAYLFVGVPGIKDLTFGAYRGDLLRMLQNAHIFNFTKDTLCRVMAKYGFSCVFCNELIQGVFKKETAPASFQNVYADTIGYLQRVEQAAGNVQSLLIARAADKLGSYNRGEVILYGSTMELDAFTRLVPDLSSIKGFFYSDKKSPEDVVTYINSLAPAQMPKCLMLIDRDNDAVLKQQFCLLPPGHDIELFSIYSEISL
ncbi:MAG: class I SAM-dependent methyltransferase [Lachnospiraceae bacterium]|nr:class I SAM-dependent methyltransferase [Lachnospiraceae bacterium]